MLNKVMLIGHLCADVELRYTQNNSPVAQFRMACSNKYKTKDGQLNEDTLFVSCTAWGSKGETLNKYAHKGSLLYVEGKLSIKKYEQDGIDKWFTTVKVDDFKFLGKKEDTETTDEPEEIPFA